MNRLVMIYSLAAAAATAVLLVLLAAETLRERRGERVRLLRARYLHIVMHALHTGAREAPRFPLLGRAGSRLLLAETLAGVVGSTYGLDTALLRRMVAVYKLEEMLLRQARRAQGYRRAYRLALLASLPVGEATIRHTARYLHSRNRAVRFHALLARIAADPASAPEWIGAFGLPFTECELSEIMLLLRRGMLPVAYEPLLRSDDPNRQRLGLRLVRQFSIGDAEPLLLRLTGSGSPELRREALYTLCSLHRNLDRDEVRRCIGRMPDGHRHALVRCMVREGYAAETFAPLFGTAERTEAETLIRTHKRLLI